MDKILTKLAQITADLSQVPLHGPSTIESVEQAFKRLLMHNNTLPASSPQHYPPLPTGNIQRLIVIDGKFDIHIKNILLALDALAHPDLARQDAVQLDLLWEQSNLHNTLQEVRGLDHHSSVEVQVLACAMWERLNQFSTTIDTYINILHERSPLPSNPKVINTSKHILSYIDILFHWPDASEPYLPNFSMAHRPSLVAVLNIKAQNLFGHASHNWCNTNLCSFKLFWEEMSTEGGKTPSRGNNNLRNSFPTDLCTACSYLKIEPNTTTYTACTKCSTVYPPREERGFLQWPAECTACRFPDSAECSQPLVKSGVSQGESVRVPIRPLVIQDFNAFVGRLLCRPGYEKLMDKGMVLHADVEELLDIKDGTTVRNLWGPDGKSFLDSYKHSELRLIWACSSDWFNPLHNKQAGKKASCGSMAMSLLNLPPSLQHKAKNIYMYLVTGKEPSLADINPTLKPFIVMMEHNYQHGTHYMSTYDHPDLGQDSHLMIAIIITDLPGLKNLLGHCSITSKKNFCSFCTLPKSAISKFDWRHWEWRQVEDLRRAAELW